MRALAIELAGNQDGEISAGVWLFNAGRWRMIPKTWQKLTVGEICTSIVPGRNKPKLFDGVIPWVTTPEIAGRYVPSKLQRNYVSEEVIQESGGKVVPERAVIMAAVGDLGLVAIAKEKVVLNQQLHAFVCSKAIDAEYLAYWLATQKSYMESVASKTTIPYMNKTNCESIPVLVPPVSEQKKIAQILSTWDKAITITEQLLANSQQQKKALMQQLLTGKKRLLDKNGVRFSGEWKWLKASELFKTASRKNNSKTEELLAVTQDQGVLPRSMLDRRVVMPDGSTQGYKLVVPGNFIISLRSFQGGLEYSNYRGLVSPAYTVLEPVKSICDEFFKQYYKSYDFIGHLAVAVIGIRDGKQVSYEDFSFLRLPYPSLEEQQKIAVVLSAIDRELIFIQKKLDALKREKKALMQTLLTGKRRVKI